MTLPPSQAIATSSPITRRSFLRQSAAGCALVAASSGLVSRVRASPTPKHVLLANCWHDINIGDIAHAPGMLQLIETHLPGTQVTLWPNPTYPNPGPQKQWTREVEQMLRAAFPRLTILPPHGTENGRAVNPQLVAAIARADLLIVGSGGFHPKPAQVWRAATTKPFGGYGNTFSSTTDRALFEQAGFLYCRDSPSVTLLRDAKIKGPDIAFGPDSTFGLKLRNDSKAGAYLRANDLAAKKFICVIPRLRHSPYPEVYGFSPSEKEKENARINAQFAGPDHAAARELIVNWVRQTRLKVLACPEMTYGVPLAREQLVDPLPADVRPHVVWRDSFWLCDEAASVFAQSLAVVSLDCHSPIIALANGTPAIHLRVVTDNLVKSRMFADIGLPQWIHENEGMTGEKLTRLVLDILRDPAAATRKVANAMSVVRERQTATMGTVRKLLGG